MEWEYPEWRKKLLILFVITLVVMLSAFFAYVETQNLRLASIVKANILFALQEISENMCNKDYEIAKKKITSGKLRTF